MYVCLCFCFLATYILFIRCHLTIFKLIFSTKYLGQNKTKKSDICNCIFCPLPKAVCSPWKKHYEVRIRRLRIVYQHLMNKVFLYYWWMILKIFLIPQWRIWSRQDWKYQKGNFLFCPGWSSWWEERCKKGFAWRSNRSNQSYFGSFWKCQNSKKRQLISVWKIHPDSF